MSALSYGYLTIIFPNEPWCLLQVIGHRCRFWVIPPRLRPLEMVRTVMLPGLVDVFEEDPVNQQKAGSSSSAASSSP